MNKLKKIIKDFAPPIFIKIKKKYFYGGTVWVGHYKTWDEALLFSNGYDDDKILERVKNAVLQVINGNAVFERDGTQNKQYSFPVLSALLYVAANSGGRLNLINFGGSLGSMYYQYKSFFSGLNQLSWNVVEQKKFVDVGNDITKDKNLKYFYSIEEAKKNNTNAILLGSVLPYLQYPYSLLNKIFKYNFEYILIDRTYFFLNGEDTLTIQKNTGLCNETYPSWFFYIDKFKKFIKKKYDLIYEYKSPSYPLIVNGKTEGMGMGFVLKRKIKEKDD